MKYSSQKLGKILKRTEEELASLCVQESNSKEFNAAVGESVEAVRPAYSFSEVQKKKELLHAKIRKIKHALNVYNVSTVIPEFDMTIDQILIYIPQLTVLKKLYSTMKDKMPRMRVANFRAVNLIDYAYTNYDNKEVTEKYNEVSETLAAVQMALDKINSVESIEIELD